MYTQWQHHLNKSEFHIQKNKDWNQDIPKVIYLAGRVWIPYPEKQGLKLQIPLHVRVRFQVWIPYPEKQGLKHRSWSDDCSRWSGLNSISRKTRIETFFSRYRWPDVICLNSISRKTRIETILPVCLMEMPIVWIPYPEKQGLKPKSTKSKQWFLEVWIPYPEKQGLKPSDDIYNDLWSLVWIPYPEKQGLKLVYLCFHGLHFFCLNSISRKTRIETPPKTFHFPRYYFCSDLIPCVNHV